MRSEVGPQDRIPHAVLDAFPPQHERDAPSLALPAPVSTPSSTPVAMAARTRMRCGTASRTRRFPSSRSTCTDAMARATRSACAANHPLAITIATVSSARPSSCQRVTKSAAAGEMRRGPPALGERCHAPATHQQDAHQRGGSDHSRRVRPFMHQPPNPRLASHPINSARCASRDAAVVASKRITSTGWVFEARSSPQPSGYVMRTPSIVLTG